MRILVVEDEESVRETLAERLRRKGHVVEEAEDGLVGIQKFRRAEPPFDVVISDFSMPRKNGVVMLGEIRKMDSTVLLVLQTASVGIGELMERAGLGDIPILYKPWDMEDLFKLLDNDEFKTAKV